MRRRWPARRPRISEPTRLRSADAIGEAFATIVARPARAFLASFGVLLAVAWLVAVLGLVSTANGQVTTAFADRLATQVTVTQVRQGPWPAADPYPADIERRLEALHGVVAAGVYWPIRLAGPVVVSATPQPGAPGGGQREVVVAASPGFLAAAGVRIGQGRLYGAWAQAHAAQVCLVGAAVAGPLGLASVRDQPTIFIDNESCTVIGLVSHAIRRPGLLRSILLPTSTAVALWGPPDPRDGATPAVLIQTRPGAAPVVGAQAPDAISPARPHQFRAVVPVRPQRLRDQVAATLSSLYVVLGWVGLAVGLLAIASVTWLSVAERMPEYALRRALGGRRRHIAIHVIWESAMLGLLGGMAGASLGLAVVVLVAQARRWVPVVAPLTVLPAPLVGAAAGILAGLIPALHAALTQPARALTRSPVA